MEHAQNRQVGQTERRGHLSMKTDCVPPSCDMVKRLGITQVKGLIERMFACLGFGISIAG